MTHTKQAYEPPALRKFRLHELVALEEVHYQDEDEAREYWEKPYRNLSFTQWKRVIDHYGYEIGKIRVLEEVNEDGEYEYSYFYVESYQATELHTLDPNELKDSVINRYLKQNAYAKRMFTEGNYASYFSPQHNPFGLDYFIIHYKEINRKHLWSVFELLFIKGNYTLDEFPLEILKQVIPYANNRSAIDELLIAKKVNDEEVLTIYRGESRHLSNIETAISWTLSYDVAKGYASENGVVYQALVDVEDILTYTNVRNEEEILVCYEDIREVTRLPL